MITPVITVDANEDFFLEQPAMLLLKQMPVAIAVMNGSNETVFSNRRLEDILGYTRADVRNIEDMFTKCFPEPVRRRLATDTICKDFSDAEATGNAVKLRRYEITCRSGETKTIELGGIATPEFKLLVINDLSERKLAEDAVEEYRLYMMELIQQRMNEAEMAKQLAIEASQAKSAFLASMSHELRTPLNSVIGFSQLLGKDQSLSDQQRRYLDIIAHAGNYLLCMINSVLELSKIEAGTQFLNLQPTGLTDLLAECLELIQLKAGEKGLHVDIETQNLPATIIADGFRLKQILTNLLTNAVKYTNSGRILLRVSSAPKQDGRYSVSFSVSDTGIGIAPENLASIFEPFKQIDSMTTKSGVGLGLAICRQYVALMGGQLEVASNIGRGSTFHFSLVVVVPDTLQFTTLQPRHNMETLRGFHGNILIADDNAESRLLVLRLLDEIPAVFSEATDGDQALMLIHKQKPDLLLLDWSMQRINGLEVLDAIRSEQHLRDIRVIIMSANAFQENRLEALSRGADDFIAKPVDANTLYQSLETQIAHLHASTTTDAPVLSQESARTMLTSLTKPNYETFRQSVLELNGEAMQQAADRIKGENESLGLFLEDLIQRYQYRQIWQLLGLTNKQGG